MQKVVSKSVSQTVDHKAMGGLQGLVWQGCHALVGTLPINHYCYIQSHCYLIWCYIHYCTEKAKLISNIC